MDLSIKHFKIIEYTDYQYIKQYNYTIPQLKQLCRHHRLRLGGNKPAIKERLLFKSDPHL